MRFFDRKKIRLLFGFTVFLVLLILNCVMYCNKAGMKRDLVVVIDVGHGGNDPGKIGVDNVKEKDVNLQIALCLKAQLQARGVKVILTREGDVCLATDGATNKKVSDMHNRVSLINILLWFIGNVEETGGSDTGAVDRRFAATEGTGD